LAADQREKQASINLARLFAGVNHAPTNYREA
jgi:hypothetical protein